MSAKNKNKSKISLLSSLFTGSSLTIVVNSNGKVTTKIIQSSHPNFKSVVSAYRKKDYEQAISLMDVQQAITTKSVGRFTVKDGQVWFKGEVVHGTIFDRIISYLKENLDFEPLLKFADLLWDNPSRRARENFFKFLEHKNLPINSDGTFTAYKGLQSNFKSCTSGKLKLLQGRSDENGYIDNTPGQTVECERSVVCDDPGIGCAGDSLHVGSYEYAKGFSQGKLVLVTVSPRDVVSIPSDCSFQKARVCKYSVLAEHGEKLCEVKDINYGKAKKSGPKRDKNGRFC